MNEATVESEIKRKGLVAPRITPADVDAAIADEQYHVFEGLPGEGPRVTVCLLTLQNGFQIVGESACADHQNFDPDLGRSLARKTAREKIWGLLGFELRSRIAGLSGRIA